MPQIKNSNLFDEKVLDAKLVEESDEIIGQLNLESLDDELIENLDEDEIESWTEDILNGDDYRKIVHDLSQGSATKLEALIVLQEALVIDTKQNFWPDLSKCLQNCLISSKTDIYLRTLRIYHKIISFDSSFCDGYLSLLNGTFSLLNSRYFSSSVRLVASLKLILNAQFISNKYLLHASRNVIDNIVVSFIRIVNFKSVFLLLGSLDSKAEWLKHFCFGTYTRNKFLDSLQEYGNKFLNFAIKSFLFTYLQDNNSSRLFSGYLCVYLFKYQQKVFPIQLGHNEVITKDFFIELINTKLNEKSNIEMCDLLIILFMECPRLVNIKMLEVLLENLAPKSNIIIENNAFITVILANFVDNRKKPILYEIYYNFCKGIRISKNIINFSQRIVDITTYYLLIEQRNEKSNNFLLLFLKLCNSLYASHSVSHLQIKSRRFLQSLHNYSNFENNNLDIQREILNLCNQFYQKFNRKLNPSILNNLLTFIPIENLKSTLTNISNNPDGFSFLKTNTKQIFAHYLDNISPQEDDDELFNVLLLLFTLKFNSQTIVALLHNDPMIMQVENNTKAVLFPELVQKSLLSEATIGENLALLSLKAMITNLDLLLHFQVVHQMQDCLEAKRKKETDSDSTLVEEILHFVGNIGFIGRNESTGRGNEDGFASFLGASGSRDFGWILQARRAFKANMKHIHPRIVAVLLDNIPKSYASKKIAENRWPSPDSLSDPQFQEDLFGIKLIVNFGLKANLLATNQKNYGNNLALFIIQTRLFLGLKTEKFVHFNWFTSIVFLICGGDLDKSKNCLFNFLKLPISSILCQQNDEAAEFYTNLSVALETNGLSFNALKTLGICPCLIVKFWMKQCFFNVLPFKEIVKFLIFCCLYRLEYCLYYLVALFYHLEDQICALAQQRQTQDLFQVLNLSGFRLDNYIEPIEKLTKKNRALIKF